MKEETIVAKKIIRDYMLANLLKPYTREVNSFLLTARQKYREHIEEAKKLTESNQEESEKQSLTHEINSYQKECDRLKDFVRLVNEGEEKKDFDFIFKVTAIKRKCEDKEFEMKNLLDKIASLKDKRQNML